MALLATVRLVSFLALRAGVRPAVPRPVAYLLGAGSASGGGALGSGTFQEISGDIQWWAVALSLVGLVIGAAGWAIGAHSSNYQYTSAGKRAVVVSGLAALLIGAAPIIVHFFFTAGQGLH